MAPTCPVESTKICITGNPVDEWIVTSKSCTQNKNDIMKQNPINALTIQRRCVTKKKLTFGNLPRTAITIPTGPLISAFLVSSDMCALES